MNNKLVIMLSTVILLLVIIVKNISNKNKFRLKLLLDGNINRLLLFSVILFIVMESYQTGILLLILYFLVILNIENNKKVYEGFIDYFTNN